MQYGHMRRSDLVEDDRSGLSEALTIMRNPLRNQWMGGPGDFRYQERPYPQTAADFPTIPTQDQLPLGPLSGQAGLDDLLALAMRHYRRRNAR